MEWQEVAKYLWGLLVPAGWWIFNKQDKRITDLEEGMKLKTEKHTVNNQIQEVKGDIALHRQTTREDIRNLYHNAEEDRKLVAAGFAQLSKEIHETHVSLLERMDGK